jgi:hypothetical protein
MADRNPIQAVVFEAIDRVNEVLLDESAVAKDTGTILLGDGAVLDSMGFVNFVVALEERLKDTTGISLSVVEELNAANNGAPAPATVNDFIEFLSGLLQRKAAE